MLSILHKAVKRFLDKNKKKVADTGPQEYRQVSEDRVHTSSARVRDVTKGQAVGLGREKQNVNKPAEPL